MDILSLIGRPEGGVFHLAAGQSQSVDMERCMPLSAAFAHGYRVPGAGWTANATRVQGSRFL